MSVGLHQGCPLSQILSVVFMDRISRRSRRRGLSSLGSFRVASLLFVDDVVLMALSGCDLQRLLEWFVTKCEVVRMRVSTSKSRKKVDCALWLGSDLLPQMEEFKYLRVLFTSEDSLEQEFDRRIGMAAALMWLLYWAVVVFA